MVHRSYLRKDCLIGTFFYPTAVVRRQVFKEKEMLPPYSMMKAQDRGTKKTDNTDMCPFPYSSGFYSDEIHHLACIGSVISIGPYSLIIVACN